MFAIENFIAFLHQFRILNNSGYSQISLKEIVQSLTAVPWSGDPFQTPMVVTTLCSLKAIDCENEKFAKAIENLLEQSKYVTEMMMKLIYHLSHFIIVIRPLRS